jgi:hypothetical protein
VDWKESRFSRSSSYREKRYGVSAWPIIELICCVSQSCPALNLFLVESETSGLGKRFHLRLTQAKSPFPQWHLLRFSSSLHRNCLSSTTTRDFPSS